MSKLITGVRPYEVFDPNNEDHRLWVGQFTATGSWAACPVRFVVEDAKSGDLVTLMQRKLVEYYFKMEFDKK